MKSEEHIFNVKFLSITAYLGPLFLIGLFSFEKNDEELKFHCEQGARLFISTVILYAVAWIVAMILSETLSTLATATSVFIFLIITALWISFAVMGVINAKKQRKYPLPLIGTIAQKG